MSYTDLNNPNKLIELLNLNNIEGTSINVDKDYDKSFCRNPISFWLVILHTFFYQVNIYGHVLTQSSYVVELGGNQAFSGVVLMMSPMGGFMVAFVYQALSSFSYKYTFLASITFLIIADLFYSNSQLLLSPFK